MGDSETVKNDSSSNRRLGTLVGGYVRRRLHRGVHPAFDALRSEENAADDPSDVAQEIEKKDGTEVCIVGTHGVEPPGDESEIDDPLNNLATEAMHERERFQIAVLAYERTTSGTKFQTDLSISRTHTWEEVLTEVNKASETYNSNSGIWNKIRKCFHEFGDNNKAFAGWLALLPSGSDWSSMLSGGLKLIIRVSARLADLRQEISNALTEIPLLLTCIRRVLKIFETSQELRQWALELYISTLGILHHIIDWYKQKAIVKVAKAVLKQESYGSTLSALIEDLRDKSTRFDKSAQLSSFEMGKETNLMLRAHDTQSHNDQVMLVKRLDQIQLSSTDNQRDVDSIKAQISDLTEAICKSFLAANSRVDFKTHQIRGPILPASKTAIHQRTLKQYQKTRDKALEALDYDSSVISHDVTTSLKEVWRLPRAEQDRILAIIHSTKLKNWIMAARSSALFINCNSSGSEKISSFTLAKLVESVVSHDSNHTIALFFFCGAHRRREDEDSGVVGLMRSLISQLLIAYPEFDVQTLGQISQIQPRDVNALCQMFYHLVRQLPSDIVVFCIIDSITTFEIGTGYLDESALAVSQLVEIVEQTNKYSCVFKLLFSSPRNSHKLYRLMPSRTSDVIWIPSRVPRSGGFTSAKWQVGVSERLDQFNS